MNIARGYIGILCYIFGKYDKIKHMKKLSAIVMINIIKNITSKGMAAGIPKPKGIANKIPTVDANPIKITTIISTIAPTADLSVSYTPNKVLNIQFGHGKNFIGDGYRSLFLSDVSSPYPFLKGPS